MRPMRAMIVDDEQLAVERIEMILSELGGVDHCRSFLNPWDAYAYAKENPPAIVFLDISMPEINGMKLSGLLHELDPTIDIVFVTGYDEYAVKAFELNALDYLLKPVTVQRMALTLDKIRRRKEAAMRELALSEHLHSAATEEDPAQRKALTEKETQIMRLIAEGLSNKEIAFRLNIAGETVKFHLKNVYRKLGVINRVQALQRLRKHIRRT